ncbi:MAG: TAXI family TRAP transporter solute-binding subunit [Deltaproteobacteria bacterium]|nr:TAXI family TRAP transporter solute-binding subunit [Deltaproteobacteria bacterium]
MSKTKNTLLLVAVLCGVLLLGGVQTAQADKNLVIAGSSVKGTWYRFAGGVASLVDKYISGYNATATPSPGSVKNVRDLRSGEIDLGMLLPSAAFQAYKGIHPYEKETPFKELRALFNTYSFPMHIIVKQNSKVKSVRDMKGLRIGTGPPGSVSMLISRIVLEQAGINSEEVKFRSVSVSENTSALSDGNVDVSFILTGTSSAAVNQLMTMHKVRYVPLGADLLKALNQEYPYMVPGVIKAGTYERVKVDVPSVTMWGVLTTTASFSEDLIYQITKSVFEHKGELVKILKLVEEMNPQNGANNLPIPLHKGAEKYYKEIGVLK